MNNVLAVVCILGLLTAIFGGAFLGIRVANLQLGVKSENFKPYLTLPIAILVIGFIIFVVTFFIASPN